MLIEITHKRAVIGNDITVKVTDDTKGVSSVQVEFDGFMIATDTMNDPSLSYDRTFAHQGNYTPGDDHAVKVTSSNGAGKSYSAWYRWTDE